MFGTSDAMTYELTKQRQTPSLHLEKTHEIITTHRKQGRHVYSVSIQEEQPGHVHGGPRDTEGKTLSNTDRGIGINCATDTSQTLKLSQNTQYLRIRVRPKRSFSKVYYQCAPCGFSTIPHPPDPQGGRGAREKLNLQRSCIFQNVSCYICNCPFPWLHVYEEEETSRAVVSRSGR